MTANPAAVVGGVFVSMAVGFVAAFVGFGFGVSATHHPFLYWLIATGTPAGVLLVLYLACWKAPQFRKGVLIGLCVWTLLAGLCNVGMTSGFKEIPTFGH